jgi:hypothetical protein
MLVIYYHNFYRKFNFLFQNSENFSSGGGQSPMNLGKSPARFDERPDTGFHSTISLVLKRKLNSKKLFHFKSQRDTLVGAKIPKGYY